jgi:hypothetical protein
MIRKILLSFLISGVLVLGIAGCSISTKPDYSADVIATTNGYTGTYKIYVSGKKSRVEGNLMGQSQISIHDGENYVSYLLLPNQKIAQVHKLKEVQAYETMFGDFEKRLGRDVKREKIGPDYVGNIECEKYKLVYTAGGMAKTAYAWYTKEGIVVKRMAEDGSSSTELKNLVIEKQPASLFEVPPDYKQVEVPR